MYVKTFKVLFVTDSLSANNDKLANLILKSDNVSTDTSRMKVQIFFL